MAVLLPAPKFSSLTSAGALLAGGLLYSYEAGTVTPLATYTDAGGGTANANPVVLDARGEANVWFDGSKIYKLVLKTAAGVTIWTVDNVGAGSDGFRFIQDGAAAVARTGQSKLRDFVNAADFGFLTTATSAANKIAWQAAIDYFGSTRGGILYINRGDYACDPGIVITGNRNLTIQGAGSAWAYNSSEGGTRITFTATGGTVGIQITPTGTLNYTRLSGLSIKGAGVLATGIKASGEFSFDHLSVDGCTAKAIWLEPYTIGATLSWVSCHANTGAYGLFAENSGGATTVYTVEHCRFRQNLIGIRIESGRHCKFFDVVSESNVQAGLEIYQALSGRVDYVYFDTCWFEGNFAEGAVGYGITIDSQVRDLSLGPPRDIKFFNCSFIDTLPTKAIDINSVKRCEFENCEFGPAQDIDIDTWGSYVTFKNCTGGVVNDSSTAWNFTPAAEFGGATTGITYTTQTGRWRQDGELVYFELRLTINSNGTAAGNFRITGLPKAAATTVSPPVSIDANGLSGVSGGITGLIVAGDTKISVFYSGTGTKTQLSDTTVPDSADFSVAGVYRVAPI